MLFSMTSFLNQEFPTIKSLGLCHRAIWPVLVLLPGKHHRHTVLYRNRYTAILNRYTKVPRSISVENRHGAQTCRKQTRSSYKDLSNVPCVIGHGSLSLVRHHCVTWVFLRKIPLWATIPFSKPRLGLCVRAQGFRREKETKAESKAEDVVSRRTCIC